MDSETIEALRSVIEYLWDDEERHWQELNNPKDHIYHDLMLLKIYLDNGDEELDGDMPGQN